jgi:hypothetical protein
MENRMVRNFFREPASRTSDMVRLVIGVVGFALVLRLGFVYPHLWIFALLLGFFSLHYMFAGLAELLPRRYSTVSGVLRIMALAWSLAGGISAVVALFTL